MNYVKVKISGLNISRLISKIVSNGVCITDVSQKKRYVTFKISENDLKILDKICKREHKFYSIIETGGLKNFIKRVPYFFGATLALVITYIYLLSMSMFVFRVNVNYESETSYDISKVNAFLSSHGISAGMRKKQFSSSEIQHLLLLNIDDIESCTVKFSGGNLNITVFPAVKKFEPIKEDLKSAYDGVITFAESYTGVLNVKPGDIVRKGDVLIKNDGGASGKIRAKVYFTATTIFNENVQDLKFTGRYLIKKDYTILNKFSIKSTKNCNFSNYLTKKCSFYLTKNLFLPIRCDEIIYYEVEIKNKVVPFLDVEEKIKNETYSQAFLKVPTNAELCGTTYSIVTENNYTRIDCFIETIIDLV